MRRRTARGGADCTQRSVVRPREIQRQAGGSGKARTSPPAPEVGPGRLTTIGYLPIPMTIATASPDRSAAAPANYESALAELEGLVASMEGGQLPLEGLLEGYRRGAELLQFCRARLEVVEQQVKVLEDGQLKP